MRRIPKGTALATATVALIIAVQGSAASPSAMATHVYTVGSLSVPGVDTGLVLQQGRPVTATATGTVCPLGMDPDFCVGPSGDSSWDTSHGWGSGFVLPGAPAWGLVGRVGSGPWVQVGAGATVLSGSGNLVFAVNDDFFADNRGSFTVTVTYSVGCYPGWGHGDKNHDHTGPPGRDPDACFPGWGYGDKNHDHSGPPGQTGKQPPGQENKQSPGRSEGKGRR